MSTSATQTTHDTNRMRLRRMKLAAFGLLVLMLAGFVLSHAMGLRGPWAWVAAFCEAAAVGALADWFAVVALFRRPLGLPIPHTAIIPRSKTRLAHSLGAFVRDHFLAPEALLEKLRVFDPAARLGQWLAEPAQSKKLAEMVRGWAQEALNFLDETAVRTAIQHFVISRLRRWNAAGTAGDLLGLLTADGRHQVLLDEALKRIGRWLDAPAVKAHTSALVVRYARREWPKITKAVGLVKPVDEIGDALAQRIATAALDELQAVLLTPEHPLRKDYEAWLSGYIKRLRDDPALVKRIEQIKQKLIDHNVVQEYVHGLWDQIHAALRADLKNPASRLAAHLEHSLQSLGQALNHDPALREALNTHLTSAAETLTSRLRHGVTEHIAQTVQSWDERQLVDVLELAVGRDLQYIRFNGTLVGGLIGLLLHAVVVLTGF